MHKNSRILYIDYIKQVSTVYISTVQSIYCTKYLLCIIAPFRVWSEEGCEGGVARCGGGGGDEEATPSVSCVGWSEGGGRGWREHPLAFEAKRGGGDSGENTLAFE